MNRRTFISSAAAVGGASLLSGERGLAQPKQTPPAWVAKLSPAVMNAVLSAAAPFQAGTPTASQLRVAQSAFSTFFANLEEVGALPYLQEMVNATIETPLTYEQLMAARALANKAGFHVTVDSVNYISGQEAQALIQMQTMPVAQVHQTYLQMLSDAAAELESRNFQKIPLRQASKWGTCAGGVVANIYASAFTTMAATGAVALETAALFTGVGAALFGVGLAVIAVYCL